MNLDQGNIKQQQKERARLLRALGIQHSKFKTDDEEAKRIESDNPDDPPTSGLPLSPDSTVHQAKQIESMFEEWWQNRLG